MDKKTAIENAHKEKVEEYDRAFQNKVNSALSTVGDLSKQLQAAKKQLLDLEYQPPAALDLESI